METLEMTPQITPQDPQIQLGWEKGRLPRRRTSKWDPETKKGLFWIQECQRPECVVNKTAGLQAGGNHTTRGPETPDLYLNLHPEDSGEPWGHLGLLS